jgi:hypothetical protein
VGILLLLAAAGGGLLVIRWLQQDETELTEGRVPGAPAVSIRESVAEHSRDGRPAWRLDIEEVQITGGGQAVQATGLREGLVYDAGKPVVRISAGQATYKTEDRSFEVAGGVRVVSHHGAIITTGMVRWVPETETLHCPGQVTMRAEGITLRTEDLDVIVPESTARTRNRVNLRTEHGNLTGSNLVYNLDTHAYTLNSIQAVFTVDSVREELGRLR